jgi:hypothetical protein
MRSIITLHKYNAGTPCRHSVATLHRYNAVIE